MWNKKRYEQAVRLVHYDYVMGHEDVESLYSEFLLMIELEDYERAKAISEFARFKGFDFANISNNEAGIKTRNHAEIH